MKKEIEKIIKNIATERFNLYPEDYPLLKGLDLLGEEHRTSRLRDLALCLYEDRNEVEIERDEKAGITKVDYIDNVIQAHTAWMWEFYNL